MIVCSGTDCGSEAGLAMGMHIGPFQGKDWKARLSCPDFDSMEWRREAEQVWLAVRVLFVVFLWYMTMLFNVSND